MLYYLVGTLYVLTCLLLIVVVLLQQGKGGDIANAFGGGASQAAFGARAGATVLSRATTVLAVLFVVGAISLGILGQRGPASVIGGRSQTNAPPPATQLPAGSTAPAPTTTPAPAVPATPAPATPAPPCAGEVVREERRASGSLPSTRKWRNWQTHQLEGLAVAIPWGFESPLPHHHIEPVPAGSTQHSKPQRPYAGNLVVNPSCPSRVRSERHVRIAARLR